ncbi:DUF4214 domain-containing protein [Oleiphilus messinensis]|nr:DUF4214 domain-containing protein [Oleiphilus messinensis]
MALASGTSAQCNSYNLSQDSETILEIYVAFYGRPADPAGLKYWAKELAAVDGDVSKIIGAFGTSPEYETRFGALNDTSLITNLYQQILGRDPDAAGLNFYQGELSSGQSSLQTIALTILGGATGPDAEVIQNRKAVAKHYLSITANSPEAESEFSNDDLFTILGTVADSAIDRDAACILVTEIGGEANNGINALNWDQGAWDEQNWN